MHTFIRWIIIIATFFAVGVSHAAALSVKLPYEKGDRFVVVQGYQTPPTHIKKDAYAIDFTKNGCDAYGDDVAAASSGTVELVVERGYNGGYGTELLIDDGAGIVSRYAHLIPDTITVVSKKRVRQGEVVAKVGNTGLVTGAACGTHPGTHLHFAMHEKQASGMFSAHNPEPISRFTNITVGHWYLSDNGLDNNSEDDHEKKGDISMGSVLGAFMKEESGTKPSLISTSTLIPTSSLLSAMTITSSIPPAAHIGGAGEIPTIIPILPIVPSTNVTSAVIVASTSINTSISSSPISISTSTLFQQLDDSVASEFSWYDDNWFNLGDGFSGTLTALTLEGRVNSADHFASHITLGEYKDPGYTALIKQFAISDDAPFGVGGATTTFTGLSIPLKPYFYYRLLTTQDYQNRSVILAGTAVTGTYMFNRFVYGVGRQETIASFMPYMIMEGFAPTSTPVPPPITTPPDFRVAFDPVSMIITPSWTSSIDPEWSANPLTYEMNYSTSSVIDPAQWQGAKAIPVAIGNTYTIALRAVDNYGAVSGVTTTTWSFPARFVPYVYSNGLTFATQDFTVSTTSPLASIELFTANFATGSRNPDTNGCGVSLYDEGGAPGGQPIAVNNADNGYTGYHCDGDLVFSFASSTPVLSASHYYRWIFQLNGYQEGIQILGTKSNTAGGLFSDPSLVNARFILHGSDGGIIFGN